MIVFRDFDFEQMFELSEIYNWKKIKLFKV